MDRYLFSENRMDNCLWFLGTAGARFSMIFQLRSTGGMWVRIHGFNILIDPGPGALVRINEFLPDLDPLDLDAIILTHRHLDHSGDINAMTEAMTYGGRIKKGIMILPEDAMGQDEPVLLKQFYHKVERVISWERGSDIFLSEELMIRPVELKHHGVKCYGFKIYARDFPVTGFMADTAFDPCSISEFEDCKRLVVNVTLLKKIDRIDHISIPEVAEMLSLISPDTILMTHLGTSVIEKGPDSCASSLSNRDTDVIAARDGMIFDITNGVILKEGKEDNLDRIDLVRQRLSSGKTTKDHRR